MTSIKYTSPWKKFILTHETTCRNCPEGFGSGSIWDSSSNVVNTTYNFSGGYGSFWGGFKMGIGNFLGGMLGGILGGLFGGFNMGTCFWGGGGGFCGCDMNQLLNPYLAISQTLQNMSQNSWWNNMGWFNNNQTSNDAESESPKTKSETKQNTETTSKKNKPESNGSAASDGNSSGNATTPTTETSISPDGKTDDKKEKTES